MGIQIINDSDNILNTKIFILSNSLLGRISDSVIRQTPPNPARCPEQASCHSSAWRMTAQKDAPYPPYGFIPCSVAGCHRTERNAVRTAFPSGTWERGQRFLAQDCKQSCRTCCLENLSKQRKSAAHKTPCANKSASISASISTRTLWFSVLSISCVSSVNSFSTPPKNQLSCGFCEGLLQAPRECREALGAQQYHRLVVFLTIAFNRVAGVMANAI